MNILRHFDLSGIPVKLTYENQTQFKSAFGGLISIIVYGLSLLYAIYVFIQWGNGDLLPKIQSEALTLDAVQFTLEEGFLEVKLFNKTKSDVDPFVKNGNIILPLVMKLDNAGYSKATPLFSSTQHQVTLSAADMEILDNSDGSINIPETTYLLLFTKCEQAVIGDSGTCASQEIIDEYYRTQLPFLIEMHIILSSYNSQTKSTSKIIKISYFLLEEQLALYTQILFQTLKQKINTNIMIDAYEESLHVNNFEVTSMRVTPNRKIIDFDIIAIFFLRLDHIQIVKTIQYPRLGEVLAQIGSIVSLLLLGQQISLLLNEQQLGCNIIHELIQFYYPSFKDVKICRNFLGKIQRVTYIGKELNLEQFKSFYTNITNQLQGKLNLVNQLYEVSRIELFLLHYFDKDKLESMKHYNLKLPIQFVNATHEENASVHPLQVYEINTQKANDIISMDNDRGVSHNVSDQDLVVFSKPY